MSRIGVSTSVTKKKNHKNMAKLTSRRIYTEEHLKTHFKRNTYIRFSHHPICHSTSTHRNTYLSQYSHGFFYISVKYSTSRTHCRRLGRYTEDQGTCVRITLETLYLFYIASKLSYYFVESDTHIRNSTRKHQLVTY